MAAIVSKSALDLATFAMAMVPANRELQVQSQTKVIPPYIVPVFALPSFVMCSHQLHRLGKVHMSFEQ